MVNRNNNYAKQNKKLWNNLTEKNILNQKNGISIDDKR